MEKTVRRKPSFPADTALFAFIPNPKPTTENCNKNVIALLLNAIKGLPKILTSTIPNKSAIGGETMENTHKTIITIKSACCK
ncbi:hypothetical protein GCM10022250_42780 [Flavobacterium chungbukense]|uniref:Uncharacterized protein n=1 Tax=Flavobacterium chungbukense TaxID=877464 RepID=A0ABP7YUY2_9FLAO